MRTGSIQWNRKLRTFVQLRGWFFENAKICKNLPDWKMLVNSSGMDFTHKCRHFPNHDQNAEINKKSRLLRHFQCHILHDTLYFGIGWSKVHRGNAEINKKSRLFRHFQCHI